MKRTRPNRNAITAIGREIGISYTEFDNQSFGDNEFIPELRGRMGIRTYREMSENNATIAAMLFAVEMTLRQVDWAIEPNPFVDAADEDIEFLTGVIFDDMEYSFADYIAEALTFLIYGFADHEIVLKRREGPEKTMPSNFDDGKIGVHKLAMRPQSSLHQWQFDKKGAITALEQTTTRGTVTIPISKLIHI